MGLVDPITGLPHEPTELEVMRHLADTAVRSTARHWASGD